MKTALSFVFYPARCSPSDVTLWPPEATVQAGQQLLQQGTFKQSCHSKRWWCISIKLMSALGCVKVRSWMAWAWKTFLCVPRIKASNPFFFLILIFFLILFAQLGEPLIREGRSRFRMMVYGTNVPVLLLFSFLLCPQGRKEAAGAGRYCLVSNYLSSWGWETVTW